MVIETQKQLHDFISMFGLVDSDKIITLLADKKVIVSPVIAKLIQDKAA